MNGSFWSRLRESHVLRALLVYAGAAWAMLEATDFFVAKYNLPDGFFFAAMLLLAVGLGVLISTAIMQAKPQAQKRDVAGPNPWEVDLSRCDCRGTRRVR